MKNFLRRNGLLSGGLLLWLALVAGGISAAQAQEKALPPLPRGQLPEKIFLVNPHGLSSGQRVALASLQGQLARRRGENIWLGGGGGKSGENLWLGLLRQRGIPEEKLDSFAAVLRHFKTASGQYVLYRKDEPESQSVAQVLARGAGAIALEDALEEPAREAGWKRIGDARGRTLESLTEKERTAGGAHPGLVIEQRAEMAYQLRDYAMLGGAVVFPAGNDPVARQVLDRHGLGTLVLGWGSAGGEDVFIRRNSKRGMAMVPTDHVQNLAVTSALPASGPLRQKAAPRGGNSGKREHLVTFVFTDGDNLSWMLNDFPVGEGWFGSPRRKEIPLGWGIAPSMAAVAPGVMEWYYREAGSGCGRDVFVAGPSGNGYFYPSEFPSGALAQHCRELNRLMKQADLRLVQILDFDALERTDLWREYLRQPMIDALLYCDYAPYDKGKGKVVWAEGKPVISARAMLWKGIAGADPDSVLRLLSSAPRTPDDSAGYSYIAVHAWSHSVADVANLIRRLPEDVRVVAPDEFVRQFRQRVREKK